MGARLGECGWGRERTAMGFEHDPAVIGELGSSGNVPVLRDGAYVRVD